MEKKQVSEGLRGKTTLVSCREIYGFGVQVVCVMSMLERFSQTTRGCFESGIRKSLDLGADMGLLSGPGSV